MVDLPPADELTQVFELAALREVVVHKFGPRPIDSSLRPEGTSHQYFWLDVPLLTAALNGARIPTAYHEFIREFTTAVGISGYRRVNQAGKPYVAAFEAGRRPRSPHLLRSNERIRLGS